MSEKIRALSKAANANIDSSVKNILEYLRRETIDNSRDGKFISSLIHLLFQVCETNNTTPKMRSSFIRKVFNNEKDYNKIHNLCLYGNLPLLDFSDMKIIDAEFSGYYEFINSKFNSETQFQNSIFEIMTEEYIPNTNLTNVIFDDMCNRDRILLEICKKNEQAAYEIIQELMKLFYGIISKFIKNKINTSAKIFSTNVAQGESRKIIDFLIKEKFIRKNTYSVQQYDISHDYKDDILLIRENGEGYTVRMIEVLKKINTIEMKVNNQDIEKYIHSLKK